MTPSDDPTSEVWGVAYKIREQDIEEVTDHLDFREKNGYSKKTVTFHPEDKIEPFELSLYVATEKNESYAGEFVASLSFTAFLSFPLFEHPGGLTIHFGTAGHQE